MNISYIKDHGKELAVVLSAFVIALIHCIYYSISEGFPRWCIDLNNTRIFND